MATVRRTAVVMNIRVLLDHTGEQSLIDVSRGEIRLTEIGGFIRVV